MLVYQTSFHYANFTLNKVKVFNAVRSGHGFFRYPFRIYCFRRKDVGSRKPCGKVKPFLGNYYNSVLFHIRKGFSSLREKNDIYSLSVSNVKTTINDHVYIMKKTVAIPKNVIPLSTIEFNEDQKKVTSSAKVPGNWNLRNLLSNFFQRKEEELTPKCCRVSNDFKCTKSVDRNEQSSFFFNECGSNDNSAHNKSDFLTSSISIPRLENETVSDAPFTGGFLSSTDDNQMRDSNNLLPMNSPDLGPALVNEKKQSASSYFKPDSSNVNGSDSSVLEGKNIMILNPKDPKLRTIFYFQNKNVHVIEPSNMDNLNITYQYIKYLNRTKDFEKPARVNFITFNKYFMGNNNTKCDSSFPESYLFNDPNIFNDPEWNASDNNLLDNTLNNGLILLKTKSVSLENLNNKFWIPYKEKDEVILNNPDNTVTTQYKFADEEKSISDKSTNNFPTNKDRIIENKIDPNKSILNIINSIDKSAVIIQKDLYITDRIIQEIKKRKSEEEKNKLKTSGNFQYQNGENVFSLKIDSVDKGGNIIFSIAGLPKSDLNIDYDLILNKSLELKNNFDFLVKEVSEGYVSQGNEEVVLLKPIWIKDRGLVLFSLLGNSNFKGVSTTDIIKKTAAVIEKEKYLQRKIKEDSKSEKSNLKKEKKKLVSDNEVKRTKSGLREYKFSDAREDSPSTVYNDIFLSKTKSDSHQKYGKKQILITERNTNIDKFDSDNNAHYTLCSFKNQPEIPPIECGIKEAAQNISCGSSILQSQNCEHDSGDIKLVEEKNIMKLQTETRDNVPELGCPHLIDNSVECMMKSKSNNSESVYSNSGTKSNIPKSVTNKSTHSEDENITSKGGEHVKKTSITSLTKNDKTDIKVSEKEMFIDPRLPVPFSTETFFEIFGSSSRLQNEEKLIQNVKSELMASVLINKLPSNKIILSKLEEILKFIETLHSMRLIKNENNGNEKNSSTKNLPSIELNKSSGEKGLGKKPSKRKVKAKRGSKIKKNKQMDKGHSIKFEIIKSSSLDLKKNHNAENHVQPKLSEDGKLTNSEQIIRNMPKSQNNVAEITTNSEPVQVKKDTEPSLSNVSKKPQATSEQSEARKSQGHSSVSYYMHLLKHPERKKQCLKTRKGFYEHKSLTKRDKKILKELMNSQPRKKKVVRGKNANDSLPKMSPKNIKHQPSKQLDAIKTMPTINLHPTKDTKKESIQIKQMNPIQTTEKTNNSNKKEVMAPKQKQLIKSTAKTLGLVRESLQQTNIPNRTTEVTNSVQIGNKSNTYKSKEIMTTKKTQAIQSGKKEMEERKNTETTKTLGFSSDASKSNETSGPVVPSNKTKGRTDKDKVNLDKEKKELGSSLPKENLKENNDKSKEANGSDSSNPEHRKSNDSKSDLLKNKDDDGPKKPPDAQLSFAPNESNKSSNSYENIVNKQLNPQVADSSLPTNNYKVEEITFTSKTELNSDYNKNTNKEDKLRTTENMVYTKTGNETAEINEMNQKEALVESPVLLSKGQEVGSKNPMEIKNGNKVVPLNQNKDIQNNNTELNVIKANDKSVSTPNKNIIASSNNRINSEKTPPEVSYTQKEKNEISSTNSPEDKSAMKTKHTSSKTKVGVPHVAGSKVSKTLIKQVSPKPSKPIISTDKSVVKPAKSSFKNRESASDSAMKNPPMSTPQHETLIVSKINEFKPVKSQPKNISTSKENKDGLKDRTSTFKSQKFPKPAIKNESKVNLQKIEKNPMSTPLQGSAASPINIDTKNTSTILPKPAIHLQKQNEKTTDNRTNVSKFKEGVTPTKSAISNKNKLTTPKIDNFSKMDSPKSTAQAPGYVFVATKIPNKLLPGIKSEITTPKNENTSKVEDKDSYVDLKLQEENNSVTIIEQKFKDNYDAVESREKFQTDLMKKIRRKIELKNPINYRFRVPKVIPSSQPTTKPNEKILNEKVIKKLGPKAKFTKSETPTKKKSIKSIPKVSTPKNKSPKLKTKSIKHETSFNKSQKQFKQITEHSKKPKTQIHLSRSPNKGKTTIYNANLEVNNPDTLDPMKKKMTENIERQMKTGGQETLSLSDAKKPNENIKIKMSQNKEVKIKAVNQNEIKPSNKMKAQSLENYEAEKESVKIPVTLSRTPEKPTIETKGSVKKEPQVARQDKKIITPFPMLLVDLDKMTKEIKPDFDISHCHKCSVPINQIRDTPILNPNKSKAYNRPHSVINVSPSKDPMLKKDLSFFPSVTKILNITLPKSSRELLRNWRKNMINDLGENGFKAFYEGHMAKGTQFQNLVQDHLIWGSDGGTPSSLCFKSLNHVLPEIRELSVINSHVLHKSLAYRGVVDCVAKYKNKPVVIEWKRLEHKKKLELPSLESSSIQLSAYVGAINSDMNYKFQVKGGIIVIAYSDGSRAEVVDIDEEKCEKFWKIWLERLQRYHTFMQNRTIFTS